jgi:hypothetical protein
VEEVGGESRCVSAGNGTQPRLSQLASAITSRTTSGGGIADENANNSASVLREHYVVTGLRRHRCPALR